MTQPTRADSSPLFFFAQEKMCGVPEFQIRSNFSGALVSKDKEVRALIQVRESVCVKERVRVLCVKESE